MIEGWAGHGLSGNRSAASLESSTSIASGLFIEGDDNSREQSGGDQINHMPLSLPEKKLSMSSKTSSQDETKRYLKTTNMASFYYRKSPDQIPRSLSHGEQMKEIIFQKQKSRSHTDIGNA